jgi:hypothetical protein
MIVDVHGIIEECADFGFASRHGHFPCSFAREPTWLSSVVVDFRPDAGTRSTDGLFGSGACGQVRMTQPEQVAAESISRCKVAPIAGAGTIAADRGKVSNAPHPQLDNRP